MAAAEELVAHLVATEADPAGDGSALLVRAYAGVQALMTRIEMDTSR
jgi:hypothetical protein